MNVQPSTEQNLDTNRPLSWPSPAGTGEWILIVLVAGAVGFFGGGMAAAMTMFGGGAIAAAIDKSGGLMMLMMCASLPVWLVVGLALFGGIISFAGKPLRTKTAVAKTERQRTTEMLGAIAISEATCSTPTTLNVPTQVVIVLTRNSFAVYGKQPFTKGFECPLDNVTDIATRKTNSVLPPSDLKLTFVENGRPFVGQFGGLYEINGDQWADKIMAIRQRGIA